MNILAAYDRMVEGWTVYGKKEGKEGEEPEVDGLRPDVEWWKGENEDQIGVDRGPCKHDLSDQVSIDTLTIYRVESGRLRQGSVTVGTQPYHFDSP